MTPLPPLIISGEPSGEAEATTGSKDAAKDNGKGRRDREGQGNKLTLQSVQQGLSGRFQSKTKITRTSHTVEFFPVLHI